MLASVAPCWVGPDRVASARRAVEAGADVLVLDDGLQNPALAKDLAFAVVDGETGFGNGLCVPAGPSARATRGPGAARAGADRRRRRHAAARADRRRGSRPAALCGQSRAGRARRRAADRPRSRRLRRHRPPREVLCDAETDRRAGRGDARLSRPPRLRAPTRSRRWSRRRRGAKRCWSRPRRTASGSVRAQARAFTALPVTLRFEEPQEVKAMLRRVFR